MKSVVFLWLVIFFSVLPQYSQHIFWRKPTLPSNPNAPIYQKLKQIPSPQTTAQSILNNFLQFQPGRVGKRTLTKEDTVVVMDGSSSIGSCEFREGKKAMSYLIKICQERKTLDSSYSCRHAGITFASSATLNFNFLPPAQASREMSVIQYPGGGTNTHDALEKAASVVRAGARRWSRQMVLLVTDGQSNNKQKTIASAKKIKNMGVELFVVAVGDKNIPGIDEMAQVATSPPQDHVFRVEKNSDLKYVFKLALKRVNNKYKAKKPLTSPC